MTVPICLFDVTALIERKHHNYERNKNYNQLHRNAEVKITAEQNFNPLFSETFLSVDKPLALHLIDKETISGEDACKSASTAILSNLLGIVLKANKDSSHIFTQKELDLKSEFIDLPRIEQFEEIAGVKFDHSKFHNRREFRAYFKKWLMEHNM